MTQDKHYTAVIFRRFRSRDGGQVIALFPELPGTNDLATCESYMHIGQHGAASVWLSGSTKPAKRIEADVHALWLELERIGYKLREVRCFTITHRSQRHKTINQRYEERKGDY